MSVAGGGRKKPKFLRSLTCDRIPLTHELSQGTKVDNKVGSKYLHCESKSFDISCPVMVRMVCPRLISDTEIRGEES